ncbi:MAG TPA: phosphatase RsbU N-terminal domain-containing protein [Candidatus Saccharimonadales bacterium]|nr:phosphatase RsbU N-terminal domain-containing protein [Candidatus Saccharimonadales bacterium]
MKPKILVISERYVAALQNHLKPGQATNLAPAFQLGRQAVALGLETLELAKVHEQALTTLSIETCQIKLVRQAEIFFGEAMVPIVETHRAGRQHRLDLERLQAKLEQRTEQLALSNRQLQRGIIRRKSVEAALKRKGKHFAGLLKESLAVQANLRRLTHQLMAAQEEERKTVSRDLQNQIAQALVGIGVRLASLKKEARINNKGLKNELASARRVVASSSRSVRRVV